eukprot:5004822-Amphidinium_carterae.1
MCWMRGLASLQSANNSHFPGVGQCLKKSGVRACTVCELQDECGRGTSKHDKTSAKEFADE